MKIAIVHDWLDTWGGGEYSLAEMLAAFPDADLFALVDFFPRELRERLQGKTARTSRHRGWYRTSVLISS